MKRMQETRPDPNGPADPNGPDLDYQITDVTSPALELHFRRDPVGNIDRLGTAPGAASPIEDYAYDDLYRLEAVQDDQAADIEAYTYDLIGNRHSKTTRAGIELYDYASDSHRLIEVDGDARTYDAVGNLISDQAGGRSYTYGDHNRLASFSRSDSYSGSYTYNGLGQRISKFSNTPGAGILRAFASTTWTSFIYDEAGRLLAERSVSQLSPPDNLFRAYVYLDDLPATLIEPDGSVYYLHADHLGTPRAVTDSAGTKRWEWQYQRNPFGEQLPDQDPENTGVAFTLNLRYPGQYHDAESGLHYNYFRDYEPGTGRYVQSDPIGLLGGLNTYAYAEQNPYRYSDPYGLATELALNICWTGPHPGCWAAVGVNACKWIAIGAVVGTTALLRRDSSDCNPDWNGGGDGSGSSCDDDEDSNCEALYQSILATCAGLTGRKKFRCFEAARIARDQCYQERR